MIHKVTAAMAAVLLASTTLAGCAHNPDEIEADYVPPITYANMSCEDLQQELIRVSEEVHKVTGQQREKARNDKLAVGAAILFWPTLFALASGDKENKLAHLKGEYDALVVNAKNKKCAYASELQAS
jgi:outer membrane murein-binding lipoprotein Lpp